MKAVRWCAMGLYETGLEDSLQQTYQSAGGVDACTSSSSAVHPLWALEFPETLFGHGDDMEWSSCGWVELKGKF